MEAKKYFEEKIRLWDSLRKDEKGVHRCVGVNCLDCPFNNKYGCLSLKIESVDIVEKWSKEHPRKTMLSDLLEKLPNIPKDDYDLPYKLCPNNLGYEKEKYCRGRVVTPCDICWNRELPNE